MGAVGEASEGETEKPASAHSEAGERSSTRETAPVSLVFLFTVATTVSVFGSFTARFVATVFIVIVARVGGESSGAPRKFASEHLSFRSVARSLTVVLTVCGRATFAVLRAGSAVTPALASEFIFAVLRAVTSPSVVAGRRTAIVAPQESNRETTSRRYQRAACLFGKTTTTLVVPLKSGLFALTLHTVQGSATRRGQPPGLGVGAVGVGRRQQASFLPFLLTEEASEARP